MIKLHVHQRASVRRLLPFVVALLTSPGSVDASSIRARITEAWKLRQVATRSFAFECSGQRLSSREFLAPPGAVGSEGAARVVPGQAVEGPTRIYFLLDEAGRVRFEMDSFQLSQETNALVPKRSIRIDARGRRVSYFPPSPVGFPSAHISTQEKPEFFLQTMPLRLIYRPLDRELSGLDEATLTVQEENALHAGRKCVLVEGKAEQGAKALVWVDPEQQFLPLRYCFYRNGALAESFDIEYRADQDIWLPVSWRHVSFMGDNKVRFADHFNVERVQLNEQFGDAPFDLQFAPGTWVADHIANLRYILRADGSRRPIAPGEYTGDNYHELLNTDPPGQLGPWAMWGVGVGAAVALLGIGIKWGRLRSKRKG